MHQKLRLMVPRFVNMKGSILLHDNARTHTAQLTALKLNELGNQILHHPAYSLDLSPTDYYLLKHFDNLLCDQCFKNKDEANKTLNAFVTIDEEDLYSNGRNKLISEWQKRVDCNGSYFNEKVYSNRNYVSLNSMI